MFAAYDLQELADHARQWIPKTDIDGRMQAIRMAAVELSEYCRLLEANVCIPTQKGTTRYPIVPTDCGLRVWRIMGGNGMRLVDNRRQTHRNGMWSMDSAHGTQWQMGGGCWMYGQREYDMSVPGYVDIHPAPIEDAEDRLDMRIWLAVDHNASSIPALIWDECRYAMQEGTIAHLLSVIGAEWSDPKAAMQRRKTFEREMSKVRVSFEKRHSTEFQTMAPPRIL